MTLSGYLRQSLHQHFSAGGASCSGNERLTTIRSAQCFRAHGRKAFINFRCNVTAGQQGDIRAVDIGQIAASITCPGSHMRLVRLTVGVCQYQGMTNLQLEDQDLLTASGPVTASLTSFDQTAMELRQTTQLQELNPCVAVNAQGGELSGLERACEHTYQRETVIAANSAFNFLYFQKNPAQGIQESSNAFSLEDRQHPSSSGARTTITLPAHYAVFTGRQEAGASTLHEVRMAMGIMVGSKEYRIDLGQVGLLAT